MALRILLYVCSASLLLATGTAFCQTAKDYLITAKTDGAIQFRDPEILNVISGINVDLPANSTGINGVSVDPNGRILYIEGPEQEFVDPNGASGCCWLYSIDLPSLQAKVAAGIWGTNSRRRFVDAGPSLLATVSDEALSFTAIENEHWQMSPDGRWWAGFRRGPAVDLYDATRNKVVKSFTAEKGNADWYLNGAWIKDEFYIYTVHDGSGWLWNVSPDSDRLEEPSAVAGPASLEGCENGMALTEMSAAGDRLVVREVFGGKIDRRQRCAGVTGGAWIIDAVARRSLVTIDPQLFFWQLIPSRDGNALYGVTSEAEAGAPSQLVYLDAHSGRILRTQSLAAGYWWIAAGSLPSIPSGEVTLSLPVKNAR
jgi:hypothetical protein